MKLNGTVGETGYDNLFADVSVPVVKKSVNLKGGQGVLLRGTVVGIETTTGLAVKVDNSKTDGTEKADSILTDDIDTTEGNVVATAYTSGLFNRKALIFGGDDTADNHETTLRTLGIYLKDNLE